MEMRESNKLELHLHFELIYIGNQNVKDIFHEWQRIYDTAPYEAFWPLIQLFVDSTGYLGIEIDHSSKNISYKNINGILKNMSTNNYTFEKCIIYSMKLQKNVRWFIRKIVVANRDTENFYEPYIKTMFVFLFQLAKKGEIFYVTATVFLMELTCILLDVGRNYSGNSIKKIITKYVSRVFAHLVRSLEYQDCVHIMCTLFINIFEKLDYSSSGFNFTQLKQTFLIILTIADQNITSKILLVIKNALENDQPMADKLFKLKLFGTKEIMIVLLHDSLGSNKRIVITAHEIVNIILNNSEINRIKQHDYTPLLFRMYDTNQAIRKLAGTTFHILHYQSHNIIEKMITFYLEYPNYCENVSYLVDAFCSSQQLDAHINQLIEIMCHLGMPNEYKVIGGQILLELFKNILCEYKELSSYLLGRLPELFSAPIPHVTLNLLEIVMYDTIDANPLVITSIIKCLIDLVKTHTDYDILCAANSALNKMNTQHYNLFMGQSAHVAVVQSIYNDYKLSRNTIREEPNAYKICLIRFCATSEFTESISEYLEEPIQNIVNPVFIDLTTQGVDDSIRKYLIILYTTLISAEYRKQPDVTLFEITTPFLQHLVTMLADIINLPEPNTLLTQGVIPGICIFYIMASRSSAPPKTADRIEDIPSYVYSNIGNALAKVSGTITKNENMRIMKILLVYWNNLHKVQNIPNLPDANKILSLYGNAEQLTNLLEDLMMSLHDYSTDRILLISSIGQSFVNLGIFDKATANNYTNSLYKFLVRMTLKSEEGALLKLLASILTHLLCVMEVKLKAIDLEKKNRLHPFIYLHKYVKRLAGSKLNVQIKEIINRILQFATLSQEEVKTLNNIKLQLEK